MRVIRNERHIRVRSFIGKNATLAGMFTLLAGLIISLAKPEWITPLMVCMVVGMGLSLFGGVFADRYVGPLAHHDGLVAALKGMDSRHVLLQYVLPAPHVLFGPGGLTVLVVKSHGGEVICQEEGRWKHRQRGKVLRQFVGQQGIGMPDYEAESQAAKLGRWLAAKVPGVEVPVQTAIVFTNPNVRLDAATSPVPAFYGKKVKAWLRGPGRLKPLPSDVYRQLAEALDVESQE